MGRHAANRKPSSDKKIPTKKKIPSEQKQGTAKPTQQDGKVTRPAVQKTPEKKPVETGSQKPDDIMLSGHNRTRKPEPPEPMSLDISEERSTGKIIAIMAVVAIVVLAIGAGIIYLITAPAPSKKQIAAVSKQDQITETQLIETYNKGDYKAVIPRMEMFTAAHKDNIKIRDMLASAYLLTGQIKQALDEYEAILKAKPNDAETLYKMGVLLEQTGRRNEAITTLDQATKAAPNVALFHAALARVDTKAKFYSQALDQWRAVLNLLPSNDTSRADVFAEMANIYILQNDVTQARGVIVTGLSLDPNNSTLKTLKATVDNQNTSTPAPVQPGVSQSGR
ncbi:MAG TPA: tetratricopeptide repeat protein [Candidatus Aquicultor sp.]